MSLNWKLTEIANHEMVCWHKVEDPKEAENIRKNGTRGWMSPAWHEDKATTDIYVMNGATNGLIWMMMGLGLKGCITKKNVEEAVLQVALYQKVNGASLRSVETDDAGQETIKPWYITAQDVRNHIGLYTNCFGKENSKAAFNRNIVKTLRKTAVAWLEERTP